MRYGILAGLLLVAVIAGCSKRSGEGSDPKKVADAVRADLPSAAQMLKSEFTAVALSGTTPDATQFSSQPLSVLFLISGGREYATSPLQSELDAEIKAGPPHRLAEAYRDGPGKDCVSLIQAGDIRDVKATVEGDVATGVIDVRVPEALDAKLKFRARRQERSWRLEQISFPAWGIATTLEDGRWVASGAACRRNFDVRLPRASFGERPAAVSQRMAIFVLAENVLAWQGADSEVRLPLADLERGLDPSVLGQLGQRTEQMAFSIRADQAAASGGVIALAYELERQGAASVCLSVLNHDEEVGDLSEIPVRFRPRNETAQSGLPNDEESIAASDTSLPIYLQCDAGGTLTAIKIGGAIERVSRSDDVRRHLTRVLSRISDSNGANRLQVQLSCDERLSFANLIEALDALLGEETEAGWKPRAVDVYFGTPRDTSPALNETGEPEIEFENHLAEQVESPIETTPAKPSWSCLAFNADGSLLAAGASDGRIDCLEVPTLKLRQAWRSSRFNEKEHDDPFVTAPEGDSSVQHVAFEDNVTVKAQHSGGELRTWKLGAAEPVQESGTGEGPALDPELGLLERLGDKPPKFSGDAMSPDGKLVVDVSGTSDHTTRIQFRDVSSGGRRIVGRAELQMRT